MSIEVQNITKLYGKQKALDQVSFTVGTGQIVGFIGPNGAGKTTAIRIITGNIPPTSGMAKVEDLNVNEHDLKIKKLIGYLPEDNPLYDDLYIREYLNYVAGIYKIKNKKSRVDEVIELTGLTKEIKKQIGALSKGYRQRVGLAQAIIHDPKVLILDEPTSGLDPNQIIEIRNLISLLGKKKTVILTTHIMQEVEAICDRVVIINNGKIVADDEASKLSSSGVDDITVIVEFDKEIQPSALKNIEGVTKAKALEDNKYLLQSKSGNDIRPKLFQYAVKNDLTVLSMNQKAKSLEDVFQELTK
ncbi:MAG: gliding motility-associated ABC transporter ATP-binding subunit GldA [Bacteroidota bacterium]|nr:gliding motility-associated ABC transporter ATP-binding subunit GldA [Bacteroidota bacterium]